MGFKCKYLIIFAISLVFISVGAYGESMGMPQMKITFKGDLTPTMTEYISGSMVLTDTDGSEWNIHDVLLKTRGATAKQYGEKPSLNLKLKDENGEELDTDLLGLRKASSFILDAMAIDRINMRNRVAFDIWNSFSRLPYETDFGSRNGTVGKFIELYLNGKYKGIYCLSDKINRKLLDLKKPEIDEATGEAVIRGVLYKNGTNDVADQNTPGYFNDYAVFIPEWHDAWELHEPEGYAGEAAWAPLEELYKVTGGTPNYEKYEYIKEHFWLENLADYAVHTIALGIADNWGNKNKYFSIQNSTKEGDKSRFVVTPWDLDTSFGGEWDGSKYDGDLNESWSVWDADKKIPMPLSVCFTREEFKKIMKDRWLAGRSGAFSLDSVTERLLTFADLFISSGAWQRTVAARNAHDLICSDLREEITAIVKWYEDRFKDMDAYLGITDEDIARAGIGNTLPCDSASPNIYDIHGIKVDSMNKPGIYIVNGRKILVK